MLCHKAAPEKIIYHHCEAIASILDHTGLSLYILLDDVSALVTVEYQINQ